jgi:hypothetical protein
MRRIRNEFAHHVEYKNFNQSPIRDYINSMTHSEIPMVEAFKSLPLAVKHDSMDENALKEIIEETLSSAFPIRAKYLVRSCLSVGSVIQEFAAIQASLAHKVHLRELITYDFVDQPPNIKQLFMTISRLSYLAIREGLFAGAAKSIQSLP